MKCEKHGRTYRFQCADCCIASHEKGVRSKNGDLFHYSAYWGNWSRVLQDGYRKSTPDTTVWTVEVDLTAINPTSDYGWPKVLSCNIREHGTARGDRDTICYSLPDYVVEMMLSRMGQETFDQLVHADLMPLIDWEVHRRITNGGAPLSQCMRSTCCLTTLTAELHGEQNEQ